MQDWVLASNNLLFHHEDPDLKKNNSLCLKKIYEHEELVMSFFLVEIHNFIRTGRKSNRFQIVILIVRKYLRLLGIEGFASGLGFMLTHRDSLSVPRLKEIYFYMCKNYILRSCPPRSKKLVLLLQRKFESRQYFFVVRFLKFAAFNLFI